MTENYLVAVFLVETQFGIQQHLKLASIYFLCNSPDKTRDMNINNRGVDNLHGNSITLLSTNIHEYSLQS